MKMRPKQWTDKTLTEAVACSRSIRQTLLYLGLIPAGGNYATIHQQIKRLNLDTSHWKGQAWNKGRTYHHRILDDYLTISGPSIHTYVLKERLIKAGYLSNSCQECQQKPTWNGKPLCFHLDHINGNRKDNRLENLRILCPNCHSQTDTYCGKKNRK